MTNPLTKNAESAKLTLTNNSELLKCCVDYFKPGEKYITVIVAHEKTLRIFALTKRDSDFKVIYDCETNEEIDQRIFCNFEDMQIYVLLDQNSADYLIPKSFVPKLKYQFFYSFSNATSSTTTNSVKSGNHYKNLSYQTLPPPAFEYFLRDVCDFEAILYFILNTTKIFMGETLELVYLKNNQILLFTFRRALLHFVFKGQAKLKNFPVLEGSKHIVIVVGKNAPAFQISDGYTVVKMSKENIKKGLEFYEKAEDDQALAICGTSNYINALEEIQMENEVLGDSNQKDVSLNNPLKKPGDKNKKVVIEIKNDEMCIFVVAKISANKSNILFRYPVSENDNNFIPMYISFLRETAVIGKNAIEDYNTHPEFVIFDILAILGKTVNSAPKLNPQWGFQLIALSESSNPKLGFKVQTFNGTKIFPVEIILAFLFKYLFKKIEAADHFEIKEFMLKFLQKKLSPSEKNSIRDIGKLLNLSINVESCM